MSRKSKNRKRYRSTADVLQTISEVSYLFFLFVFVAALVASFVL